MTTTTKNVLKQAKHVPTPDQLFVKGSLTEVFENENVKAVNIFALA